MWIFGIISVLCVVVRSKRQLLLISAKPIVKYLKMFTSRKISSKGHNECDNGSNSGINSVSVSTKFSLTSFYGAKYAVTEILSESDSDSNNYNDDNNTDSFALCGGQTNDIEFDIGDSVVFK